MRRRTRGADRTRRRFARRQWARRWLTWRYLLATTVTIALLAGGIWAVYYSDTLAIEGVEVRGLASLTEDDVVAVADVPEGTPLATVDLTAIDRRVSALAAVASVRVTRQWPHDVLIEVTERTPVAVVDRGDGLRAVDVEGAVFSTYQRAPSDLPRITTAAVTDLEALREAATVAGALPDDVRVLVDHIEVESIDEITLVLRDGRRVRWGSADQSDQKAEVLAALLPRKAEIINVSVPGQPTTR